MQNQNPIQVQESSQSVRLNEIEEKQRLLRDRILLIGENLISTKEEYEQELSELKNKQKDIELELKQIKQQNKKIIFSLQNLAKKSEVEILKNQFKMFEPLELVRVKDIKEIIEKEMKR